MLQVLDRQQLVAPKPTARSKLVKARGLQRRTPTCPVERLGREYVALTELLDKAVDDLKAGQSDHEDGSEAIERQHAFDREEQAIYDRFLMIEEAASFQRATSLVGAMFQLLLARTDAENISVNACALLERKNLDDETRARELSRLRELMRRFDRYVYSIVAVLEEAARASRSVVGGEMFMPKSRDVGAILAEKLARRTAA